MKKVFPIIIFFFILAVFFIWRGIYLPKNPVSAENQLFMVEKGQGLFQIAENLEKEGLIKNKFFFDFYVLIRGKAKKLQAGEYELNPSMNAAEIAKKIISGETFKIKITIPECFNLKQTEVVLGSDLRKILAKDFKGKFNFLRDVPDAASLEGFLFPDTYFFERAETLEERISKILDNFDKKMNTKIPELGLTPQEVIARQGKTIFEIIIMASLIEKEVKIKTEEEKEAARLVSGILWKRLKNNIPLQVDATITYITGKKTTKISKKETQIDSPYNTYKYLGLPPGPICNPGLESILAALYPKDSEYWYYLSTPDGQTIFSKTLEEHNYAKAKYLK